MKNNIQLMKLSQEQINSKLEEFNEERCRIAERYINGIDNDMVQMPRIRPGADSTWHQFVVHIPGYRDKLMDYLKSRGIGTLIHYPIPPHLSEAYAYLLCNLGDGSCWDIVYNVLSGTVPVGTLYTMSHQEPSPM